MNWQDVSASDSFIVSLKLGYSHHYRIRVTVFGSALMILTVGVNQVVFRGTGARAGEVHVCPTC